MMLGLVTQGTFKGSRFWRGRWGTGANITTAWSRRNVNKKGSKSSSYHIKSAKLGLQKEDITRVTERELSRRGDFSQTLKVE